MRDRFKTALYHFFQSRLVIIGLLFCVLGAMLVGRLFQLQIIDGASYVDHFTLKTRKETALPCPRGQIRDRNGKLLAYNELVYSVRIEDQGEYRDLDEKNQVLNDILIRLFRILEEHGSRVDPSFSVCLDQNGQYRYTAEDKELERFLANVYGVQTGDLTEEQKKSTPDQVMEYLCGENKYNIAETVSQEDRLKLVTIRYGMSENNYKKYISTLVAQNIDQETAAAVMEHADSLPGVSVEEDYMRRYGKDSQCFSHILGYTGQVSSVEELDELTQTDDKYTMDYSVGKSGIEKSMESVLQGTQGQRTFYVDNLGKVLEEESLTEAAAGNDVVLTIDADLQKTIYDLLEAHLAGILLTRIVPDSGYETHRFSGSDSLRISIDDVYSQMFGNNVISMSHLQDPGASSAEQAVYRIFSEKKNAVLAQIRSELEENEPPRISEHSDAEKEYLLCVGDLLEDSGIVDPSLTDTENDVYKRWNEGDISLKEYIQYTISAGWIDPSKLTKPYVDFEETYADIKETLLSMADQDRELYKKIFQYLILDREITGAQVCLVMFDQGAVEKDQAVYDSLNSGSGNAYDVMYNWIRNLQVTPAQIALEPCSASVVLTDTASGEVLAMVSYPGYDLNRLANKIDSEYYSRLLDDQSLPLVNRATQQKTAPGSTFKPITATAGLEEGFITPQETIEDEGIFNKISPAARCWIYPGRHGSLNVTQAILHSCNYFFYEVGYRMSIDGDGDYNDETGTKTLSKYAALYGLDHVSGVQISESAPQISDAYPVASAIGQGRHNYTTSQIARYVTALATKGTLYDLTLVQKTVTSDGEEIQSYGSRVADQIELQTSTWNSIHEGMRLMAQSTAALNSMGVHVAGKTGTAQETKSHGNHALFIGFAPYEQPEITIATRIANGYTSSNAVDVSVDVLDYYFKLKTEEQLLTGGALLPRSAVIHD